MFSTMAIFWTAGVIVQALFGAATPISGDSIKSNNALDNFNATVNHSLAARARTQCDPKASSQKDWSGDWSFEKDGMNCNMNDGEWPYGDAHQCSSYNIAGDLVAADRSETITTEANGCKLICESCDIWSSAWLCSPNDHEFSIKKHEIGFVVWQITYTCNKHGKNHLEVGGQMFVKGKGGRRWNIILRNGLNECK